MKTNILKYCLTNVVILFALLLVACTQTNAPDVGVPNGESYQDATGEHVLSAVRLSKDISLSPGFVATTEQYDIVIGASVAKIELVEILPVCARSDDGYTVALTHRAGGSTSTKSSSNGALTADLASGDSIKILVLSRDSKIRKTYAFTVKNVEPVTETTTGALQAPAGFSLNAEYTKKGWVYFSWQDTNQNETGIILESKTKNGSADFAVHRKIEAANVTWTALEDVSPGVYLYRIKAYNDSGSSAYSNTVEVTVHPYPQGEVANLGLCANVTEAGSSMPGHNLYWDAYAFPSYNGYDIEYGYAIYSAKWLRTESVIPELEFISVGVRKASVNDTSQTRIGARIAADSLSSAYMYTYQICLYYKYTISLADGSAKEKYYEGPRRDCGSSASK
jgi:hypothetical protein